MDNVQEHNNCNKINIYPGVVSPKRTFSLFTISFRLQLAVWVERGQTHEQTEHAITYIAWVMIIKYNKQQQRQQ
jgi:hypothetical protein